MIENAPFRDITLDATGKFSSAWMQWIQKVGLYAGSVSDSGTTAQRPTSNLYIGRQYFDSTLGYPVWIKTVSPVVWVNGAGATV